MKTSFSYFFVIVPSCFGRNMWDIKKIKILTTCKTLEDVDLQKTIKNPLPLKNYGQLYLVPFNYVFDLVCHLFILLSPADFWWAALKHTVVTGSAIFLVWLERENKFSSLRKIWNVFGFGREKKKSKVKESIMKTYKIYILWKSLSRTR